MLFNCYPSFPKRLLDPTPSASLSWPELALGRLELPSTVTRFDLFDFNCDKAWFVWFWNILEYLIWSWRQIHIGIGTALNCDKVTTDTILTYLYQWNIYQFDIGHGIIIEFEKVADMVKAKDSNADVRCIFDGLDFIPTEVDTKPMLHV